MSLSLGNTTIGSLYLGSTKVGAAYLGNVKVWEAGVPAKTLRFKFKDSFNPVNDLTSVPLGTWTQVASDTFDYHYDSTLWYWDDNGSIKGLFNSMLQSGVNYPMGQHHFDIIDGNLAGVTSIRSLFNSAKLVDNCKLRNTGSITDFYYCFNHNQMALVHLEPLDITSATNMGRWCYNARYYSGEMTLYRDSSVAMQPIDLGQGFYNCSLSKLNIPNGMSISNGSSAFYGCTHLTEVPLFSTDSCTDVTSMFYGCRNVTGGARTLYIQMSTQTTPPSSHVNCFKNCGEDTVTGAAELSQIPTDWGGTKVAPSPSEWDPDEITVDHIRSWEQPSLQLSTGVSPGGSVEVNPLVSISDPYYPQSAQYKFRVSVNGSVVDYVVMESSGGQLSVVSYPTLSTAAGDELAFGFYAADQTYAGSYDLSGTIWLNHLMP